MTGSEKTIASLLTPLAPGAIAVIALRGPRAIEILHQIVANSKPAAPALFEPGIPRLCRIFDGDQVIDDAIIIVMQTSPQPHVELNTHGGVRVVQRVLELLQRLGAVVVSAEKLSEPGIDPNEAIIHQLLISAGSPRVATWLLAQRGLLPALIRDHKKLDHDQRAEFEKRSQVARRLLKGIRIAIIGPPNAGKSTLANCLIGHERVITSDTPGTTRDWISETALIKGWPVILTDTAGIRETACELEAESIRRGSQQARSADLVLIVIDGSLPAAERTASAANLRNILPHDQAAILILNKCDLLSGIEPAGDAVCISALREVGIDTLEGLIATRLGLDQLRDDLPVALPGINYQAD